MDDNFEEEFEDEEEERDLSECPVCGFVNVSLEKELNNGRCFNCDSPLE